MNKRYTTTFVRKESTTVIEQQSVTTTGNLSRQQLFVSSKFLEQLFQQKQRNETTATTTLQSKSGYRQSKHQRLQRPRRTSSSSLLFAVVQGIIHWINLLYYCCFLSTNKHIVVLAFQSTSVVGVGRIVHPCTKIETNIILAPGFQSTIWSQRKKQYDNHQSTTILSFFSLSSTDRTEEDSDSDLERGAKMASISTIAAVCAATTGRRLLIAQFPCLSDNYGYLVHDTTTGQTAAIDTPDGSAYVHELDKRGWRLTHIFNTHHHWDHTGGNLELLKKYNPNDSVDTTSSKTKIQVYGPKVEEMKIPGITDPVQGGDTIEFGLHSIQIMNVGGHTLGHIAYYCPSESLVFVGDSLFALGCGRMFEGTPTQYWQSLQLLRSLPDETTVYW